MSWMLLVTLMFPPIGRFWDRPFFRNPILADSLGLTEAQVQKLEELFHQTQAERIRIRSELALKRLELRRELEAEKPDKGKIDKLVEEIGKLQAEMLKNRVRRHLGVREILTSEQRAYLRRLPFRRPHHRPPHGPFWEHHPEER